MKSNCHTHTLFCDGKNTAEEMVLAAIEDGFDVLGFSVHSPMDYENEWGIEPRKIPDYIAEINRLKEKYIDSIKIFCGIELDADYEEVNLSDFDYSIGSVHSLKFGEKIYSIDNTAEELLECIKNEFSGNSSLMAKVYFERLADFVIKEDVDLVGHFDLLMKFNERTPVFDERDELYVCSAISSIEKILKEKPGMLFEINTGAMYRKGNSIPYPAEFILKCIKDLGGKITITSDAHCVEALDFKFDSAFNLAKKCGFSEAYHLTEKRTFKSIKIS